jgi:hypothetical protein
VHVRGLFFVIATRVAKREAATALPR